jgi:hypothetical protein
MQCHEQSAVCRPLGFRVVDHSLSRRGRPGGIEWPSPFLSQAERNSRQWPCESGHSRGCAAACPHGDLRERAQLAQLILSVRRWSRAAPLTAHFGWCSFGSSIHVALILEADAQGVLQEDPYVRGRICPHATPTLLIRPLRPGCCNWHRCASVAVASHQCGGPPLSAFATETFAGRR